MTHRLRLIQIITVSLTGIALLLTTGCDRNDLLKLAGYDRVSLMRRNTPQREESIARRCAESLRLGKYDDVLQMSQPDIIGPNATDALRAIHDTFGEREPASIKVIDAQSSHDGHAQTTRIVLDYEFSPMTKVTNGGTETLRANWIFIEIQMRNTDSASPTIIGIHSLASAKPVESINAFTFGNKGLSQYAAFAIGILLVVFTFYAAVLCIRSQLGAWRWFWLVLMLFTVSFLSVNWTTGDWSFNKISFGFAVPPLPANVTCSAYGPWNLTLGLPIGAFVFCIYRRLRLRGVRNATTVRTAAH